MNGPAGELGRHDGTPRLRGVVLCGGNSTRMGRDKATIGDPPWAHRVAAVLEQSGCVPVDLLGVPDVDRDSRGILAAGRWELIADRRPGAGPATALADYLAGVRDRGELDNGTRLVVAACDLPNLMAEDVEMLDSQVATAGGLAAFSIAGRPQLSLLSVDPVEVQRISRTAVAEGMSLRSLLGQPSVLLAPVDAQRVTDVDEQ